MTNETDHLSIVYFPLEVTLKCNAQFKLALVSDVSQYSSPKETRASPPFISLHCHPPSAMLLLPSMST